FIILQSIPTWSTSTRVIITIMFLSFLFIDHIDVIYKLNKDEREIIHEAKSERNALWIITIIISLGLVYQIIMSGLKQELLIDWVLVFALIAGLITKSISNIYLDKKN
ncbi:MAG: hypothetical protein ACP5D2_04700, partial [Candidatus Nanoarchaeia archaeon]